MARCRRQRKNAPVNPFTLEATWWLPDDPDRRVTGNLTFDDEGVRLVTDGALRPVVLPPGESIRLDSPKWTVMPVVHGRTRDFENVSLLGVSGANLSFPGDEVQESYLVSVALLGGHATHDAFTEARVELDWLDAWLDPPSLIEEPAEGAEPGLFVINRSGSELANVTVDGDMFRLVTRAVGSNTHNSVRWERRSEFVVVPATPLDCKGLLALVRPFQDLLTLAVGRPTRLTSLHLHAADAEPNGRLLDARLSLSQAPPKATPSVGELRSYTAPTLMRGNEEALPLNDMLSAWYPIWNLARDAVVHLNAPHYAPFIYSEHRFNSAFQAVESLHKQRFPTQELEKAAHAARLLSVEQALQAAGVDVDTVKWAMDILGSRNDKRLAQRVTELLSSTGPLGEEILSKEPTFATTVTRARSATAHPNLKQKLGPAERHWHGEVLQWVARAVLLSDLGVQDVNKRVIDHAAFRFALDQIQALRAADR